MCQRQETPRCSRCTRKDRICEYNMEEDKRRLYSKKAVEVLSRRVVCLTAFIKAANMTVPEVQAEDRFILETLSQSFESQALQESPLPHSASSNMGQSPSRDHEEIPPMEPSSIDDFSQHFFENLANSELHEFPMNVLSGLGTESNITLPSANPLNGSMKAMQNGRNILPSSCLNPEFGGEEREQDEQALLDDLSNRMGYLHLMQDGQMRFYGATSNFTLSKSLHQELEGDIFNSWNPDDESQADIEVSDPDSEAHLEALFFCWQNPVYHVVDEGMYYHAKWLRANGHGESTFYSSLLTNIVCASGALLDSKQRQPRKRAEIFARRAKALLEVELDSPKVATVQALVIFSLFEAGATRDPRGWLYSGMAVRLSFDLGLHIDMAHLVYNGKMTTAEEGARRTTFWGCYNNDHWWGLYLGRPFYAGGNITVTKPHDALNEAQQPIWTPYPVQGHHVSRNLGLELQNPSQLIFHQWINLYETQNKWGDILYGSIGVSEDELFSAANSAAEDLETWNAKLPDQLQVDLDNISGHYLPHLLLLHMQFHQILIYIHRPFISTRRIPDDLLGRDRFTHSRQICFDSALAITKLLDIYQSQYTLQRTSIQVVGITFSAALMLLFGTLIPPSSYDPAEISQRLTTCCRTLVELGKPYENSSRALDLLLRIKRDWKARLVSSDDCRENTVHGKDGDLDAIQRGYHGPSVGDLPFAHETTAPNLTGSTSSYIGFDAFAGIDLRFAEGTIPSSFETNP